MLRIENHACIWYNNRNYSAIRRSVMHYHKVPLLCFLNAATEFILLVTVFILAGVLRAFSEETRVLIAASAVDTSMIRLRRSFATTCSAVR